MTITVSKSNFLSALQIAGKIISSRPSLPITLCFLLKVKNQVLYITAADSAGRINTSIQCEADSDHSGICVDAKMLLKSLKVLPEQPVKIEIQDLSFRLYYRGGKYELLGQDPDIFPLQEKRDPVGELNLLCSNFLRGISKTLFCALTDDTLRPAMSSVYVDVQTDRVCYVASDGHKLALLEQENTFTNPFSFIIPYKIISILKAILPKNDTELRLTPLNNFLMFEFGKIVVIARLQEERYPNYRSVIPTNDKNMLVETSGIQSAVNRVSVFSNQGTRLIKFSLTTDKVQLVGQDIDFSTSAQEELRCEYQGRPFEIGMKGSFLAEILSHIDAERSDISFSEPGRPLLIKPATQEDGEELTYLLMPMMLNE
ncbi:MAG: DNA polymerase III subunit beta [Tannerellaceae bacterium]|nr:DNA polymerase III subunit beta [Tannerellaceae bacterium]